MPELGVNVDHVATVRQARRIDEPDPVFAAYLAEQGGADGITVHLREDRRHIQERDLAILRQTVRVWLNLEMAATEEMQRISAQIKPHKVTLVPERRQEVTTEGGLDVAGQKARLGDYVGRLVEAGHHVSMFIDPDERQVAASREVGAHAIEIHTGAYANAPTRIAAREELGLIAAAARAGADLDLMVNAGHGLNYRNTPALLTVREIVEYNIGHAIVARALFVGMERAVREMVEILRGV